MYKIVTRDANLTLYYTDHDREIEFNDGSGPSTYTPFNGWQASARQLQSGLNETNLDTLGVIDSDSVSHEDLRAGRFAGASVTEFLVDWRVPFAGAMRTRTYEIGNVSFNGETWTAELNSLPNKLLSRSGRLFGRTCDADVYDDRCKVVEATYTTSNVAVAASSQDATYPRRIFEASSLTSTSDGYYDYGEIVWVTGDNADRGVVSEVKVYTDTDRKFELYENTPFDIGDGDLFNVKAGCDKLPATCHSKFNNLPNGRFFHLMPSSDRVLKVAGR